MFGSKTQEAHSSSNPLPLGHVSSPTQQARKRKYDEISTHIHLQSPFTIQAHSLSPIQEPLRLVPKLLIPRSCLPIAFFDLTVARGDFQSNKFISARIPALEQNISTDQISVQLTILIAASGANDCLYAVERVRCGTYALCRLAAWVTLQALERSKLEHQLQPMATSIYRDPFSDNEWWHALAIKADADPLCDKSYKANQVDILRARLCMKPPRLAISAASPVSEETPAAAIQGVVSGALSDLPDEPPSQQLKQDPDQAIRMIRVQYQEALYMSQASLAYFAKGPLSRARALFNRPEVLSSEGLSLPEYLRTCILSLSTMDKKYKDTLPSIIKELPIGLFSDNENVAMSSTFRKKKSRKTKYLKIGKDGLYPEEEGSIIRWWLSRSSSTDGEDSPEKREDGVRTRVLEQRARETQLQIIIMLETLALEASKPGKASGDDPIVIEEKHLHSNKKQKSKKLQNLTVLLDLLIDRLCIWQSMSVEDGGSTTHESNTESRKAWRAPTEAPKSDGLRNFCTDVILPFYSARLPDMSAKLCQKLGGPKPLSPARTSLRKAAGPSKSIKRPGVEVRRQQVRQPRQTLERVLTEQRSTSRSHPPSLSRSATEPLLPQLKREVSEVSLSSIPLCNFALSKSRRYSQREVDLSAVSQSNEAKLKKKASVEKELQGAIAALTKPNPRMAVKDLIEAAEKRTAGSSFRKKKKPVRNPLAQSVQVMATPRRNRQKDVSGGPPYLSQSQAVSLPELDEIPPSSALRAVSSTPRMCRKTTAPKNPDLLPSIEQTPSRGPSKFMRSSINVSSRINQPNELSPPPSPLPEPKYPLKTSNIAGLETPLKPTSWVNGHDNFGLELQNTPIKRSKDPCFTKCQNHASSPVGAENDTSIYKSLGWDDEVEEFL